jgi:hypothetical protein
LVEVEVPPLALEQGGSAAAREPTQPVRSSEGTERHAFNLKRRSKAISTQTASFCFLFEQQERLLPRVHSWLVKLHKRSAFVGFRAKSTENLKDRKSSPSTSASPVVLWGAFFCARRVVDWSLLFVSDSQSSHSCSHWRYLTVSALRSATSEISKSHSTSSVRIATKGGEGRHVLEEGCLPGGSWGGDEAGKRSLGSRRLEVVSDEEVGCAETVVGADEDPANDTGETDEELQEARGPFTDCESNRLEVELQRGKRSVEYAENCEGNQTYFEEDACERRLRSACP